MEPETERERELRAFASRVLAWPDPDGPSAVDLLPHGYPDDVPPELVENADLRFLGSVVRRRGGELLRVELLFERAAGTNEILDHYEHGLINAGWQRANQPGLHRGGFEGSGLPLSSTLVHADKRLLAYIQAWDENGQSLLRVVFHESVDLPLLDHLMPDAAPGGSPLPVLRPPAGVRMQSLGSGGGGERWSSAAKARADLPPMELEAHFARQLEKSGWGRMSGSADDSFAWSSWLRPDVPPTHEWRGVLLVLAAFSGERLMSFWAESARR